MQSIKIMGTGRALPARVLTNADLEQTLDTSDAWIVDRTGIRERRIADEGTRNSDLIADAIRRACESAGMEPKDLDAIIVGTSTPDTLFPSTACWVEQALGIRGMPAFDISAGCCGFLYGLELATSMIHSGRHRRVAVCGGEIMSRVLNWKDRSTCVLFGDGAGAVVVGPGDGRSGVLASNWGSDGNLAPILYQPAGGTRQPATHQTVDEMAHTVHMEGNTVFKHAVTAMATAALDAMRDAGMGPNDIDLLIPHQANVRIMESTRERTKVDPSRLYSILHKYGNMSAAGIPVALSEARDEGRIRDGDIIVLTAFGTGFTWGASVLRW